MRAIERVIIDILLEFTSVEVLNSFLTDPRNAAILVGALVAISGALLGAFLLLRGLSMTSDAISHTVLLGIVVAFILMVSVFNMEPDLSSPWLIIGAAAAGVLTVFLTELIHRSGLVKADAALGLAFPFLFAISIILISGYVDKAHIDTDAVMVGEIGLTWANTHSHCYDDAEKCDDIVITPDDPRAEVGERCVNCGQPLLDEAGNPVLDDWGEPIIIQARPPGYREPPPYVEFEEYCYNCGTYTPGEALSAGLISELPRRVHWPEAITVMGLITLVNFLFVVVLYKELKLVTFDAGLAAALGFRPGTLHYVLMALVSITAVGAFDAVGSILVVAFFIIPPAAAYLLTERLSIMLVLSAIIGGVGTYAGYYFSRGEFLGLLTFDWNTSISAAMVLMLFFFLLLAWVLSPRYGLVSSFLRRYLQKRFFGTQMLLGHIYHHQNSDEAAEELVPASLNEHLNWTKERTQRVIRRAQTLRLVNIQEGLLHLTGRGEKQVKRFMAENLGTPQTE